MLLNSVLQSLGGLPTYTLSQWHEYLYELARRQHLFEEKIILADTDPKQLLTVNFVCF